jgi:predicted 3-demethylubiquinone-9 3-methyltransferase (glyoxalase superfamily)
MASLNTKQKIMPCLWFDANAEEAVAFYLSVFKKSRRGLVTRYGEGAPLPKGTALTIEFTLLGEKFLALNGGPYFKFSEAVSFVISCATQKEIDYYWQKLVAGGGAEGQCGWLKDKFGLSWQVAPSAMVSKMLSDKKAGRAARVMKALMPMKKIDIRTLKAAYDGK